MTIERKNIDLRDYQKPAKDALINAKDIIVLGIAPNGGKTKITISALNDYCIENPKAKILIIPHSTNVLKRNFVDSLDESVASFTYSTNLNDDVQVHISLPHSEGKMRKKYDLIIIDEAHENYEADRVQRIINTKNPSKQWLLTGTPYNFIKKGWNEEGKIHVIAANEIPEEYFAKLQVELISSNYNWLKYYNSEGDVKNAEYSLEDTKKLMEDIILKLLIRVKSDLKAGDFNNPKVWAKIKMSIAEKSFFGGEVIQKISNIIFKKLGKTMIICNSTKQSSDVYDTLKKYNIKCTVSDYKSDKGSEEIAKFKNNEYDVLIVVDRARLGYSDDDLYNVIDMSGSHNPNMIYQTFSRVLRGNPSMQKYYLKVTTQEYGMMDLTHASVCAALMLTDRRYLSTFNGNNIKGIKIPIIKNPNKPKQECSKTRSGNRSEKFEFPEFTSDVIDLFRNIINNLDSTVSVYKLTTISEIRDILKGKEPLEPLLSKDEIFGNLDEYLKSK